MHSGVRSAVALHVRAAMLVDGSGKTTSADDPNKRPPFKRQQRKCNHHASSPWLITTTIIKFMTVGFLGDNHQQGYLLFFKFRVSSTAKLLLSGKI